MYIYFFHIYYKAMLYRNEQLCLDLLALQLPGNRTYDLSDLVFGLLNSFVKAYLILPEYSSSLDCWLLIVGLLFTKALQDRFLTFNEEYLFPYLSGFDLIVIDYIMILCPMCMHKRMNVQYAFQSGWINLDELYGNSRGT